ncbi:MAG TPA: 30S ribosomal protein S9 [Nitrospiraceae bacterium]|nr:MAG: 30S ribosomal protein S9 [Nitrospirae bacterium RIFCSPHIGHO2_02_FULL_42_12]HAS18062.1 30S ribosomal protein S9 [Nitrospiraceae bacterium]HBI24159.1 30S ribosomal protein S9 [Nitrospiraceae bacterium]
MSASANISKYYATGKRKNAIARVWISPGDGSIVVNERKAEDYFLRLTLLNVIKQPLDLANLSGKYDVFASVSGGGISSQAAALKHGIAKGLLDIDPALRSVLKKKGLLTRDSREKERKKYGQKGARKKFQFSKR